MYVSLQEVYLECTSERDVYEIYADASERQRRPRIDIQRKIPSLASRPSPPLIMLIILITQVRGPDLIGVLILIAFKAVGQDLH